MTVQERKTIVSAISKQIKANGFLRLNQLSKAFLEEGIDRSIYASTGPKKWIMENFPEFAIEGSNGFEKIVDSDNPLVKVRKILKSELSADGKLLLAEVPGRLAANGIQYKELARGQKLVSWITNEFPEFGISEDNRWMIDKYPSAPEPAPVAAAVDEAAVAEIQQMHSIAFMNWWNTNIKKLKAFNETLTAEEQVKSSVAHQLGKVLLGDNSRLIDKAGEKEGWVAFDTGLASSAGTAIYCILMPNPKNVDGTKQSWTLMDFSAPDQDTPLGNWLKKETLDDSSKYERYTELEEKVSELEDLRVSLIPAMEQYLSGLTKGNIPSKKISREVLRFEELIRDLEEIYEDVWEEKLPEEVKIEQLMKQIDENNIILQQIENSLEIFDKIAAQTEEMFLRDRLPALESGESTPQKDRAMLHRYYDQLADNVDLAYFKRTLRPYKALLRVMSAETLTDEIDGEIGDVLCPHFPEIPYRFAIRVLMGSDEKDYSFLKEVENLEKILEECEGRLASGEEREHAQNVPSTPKELMEAVQSANHDGLAVARYAAEILPEDPAAKMLVLAQMEELSAYIQNNGKGPLNTPEILSALKQLPSDLTYYSAAERLFQIIGNKDRLAEKYYILGLPFDEKRCTSALLELYRKEGNIESFEDIYVRYFSGQDSHVENQVFYLNILCRRSPEQALKYAQDHYYLFYLEESLKLLLELPEGSMDWKLASRLRERYQELQKNSEQNALEKAVIRGDYQAVKAISETPGKLEEEGYSEEERKRIQQALREEAEISGSMDTPEARDDYAAGIRLYRFQKNRRNLAETYMWKGIAANKNIKGVQLMLILAQEGRWEECCELYEHFQTEYSESSDCRQAYLVAAVNFNYAKGREYILRNLQDCLGLAISAPIVRTALERAADTADMNQREFYLQVLSLSGELEDPLVKSAVLMDRALREYAVPIHAKEQGVPEELVNRISTVYQSNQYSHGSDAAGVSERVFSLLGTYRGAAEKFAKFALPDPKAVNCLWAIYSDAGDDGSKLELLQQFPHLKEGHLDFYLDHLFRRGKYSAYIEECGSRYLSCGENLQKFIASLKINPSAGIIMPPVSEFENNQEADQWFAKWGGLLTSTLLQARRMADMEEILSGCFDGWLDRLDPETIREIITGNGTAGPDDLINMQQSALENGKLELALYFYNVLGAGSLKEQSDQFIQQRLDEAEEKTGGEKWRALNRLQTISGGIREDIAAELSLLKIAQIKADNSLTFEEAAKQISNEIGRRSLGPDAVSQLLLQLEDEPFCWSGDIYRQLEELSKKIPDSDLIIRHFHKLAVSGQAKKYPEFLSFVCRFNIDALKENRFPEDLVSQLCQWCIKYVENCKNAEGLLCLYFAEKALGRGMYAQYLLRVLADISYDTAGKVLDEIIAEQLQATWGYSLPGYFDLFKGVLNESSIEEIKEYISFAHRVSFADSDETERAEDSALERENNMLSEQSSSAIVRQLFADPEDAGIWRQCTKLPLQDIPPGCAKLSYLASEKNADLWKSCADYCEKYEQTDLLLDGLSSWAMCDNLDDSAECRKYLEEQLMNDPSYFKRWEGNEKLLRISEQLCGRVRRTETEYHATLRALSLIAIESGFPKAVEVLFEQFQSTLFGSCCNLSVVIAVRLLMAGRYGEAKKVLSQLVQMDHVLTNMNYRELVRSLSKMAEDEIAVWTENAENRIMIQMILPDGNIPKLQQINAITYEGLQNGQEKETALVLCRILEMFKNDYGAYNALYDVCCTQFEGFLPILHMALRGLVRLRPVPNAAPYYRRDQKQYAGMLAVLDALLISNNQTDQIQDYDFTKSAGEYYRANAGSVSHSDITAVSEIGEKVAAALKNRSPEEVKNLSRAYLSVITGNWTGLLKDLWTIRGDAQMELNCRIDEIEDLGFARSILKLLLPMDGEERREFISWLEENAARSGRREKERRQNQINFAAAFYREGYFDQLEAQTELGSFDQLLKSPFEDYSYTDFLLTRYLDPAIDKKSEDIFALAWLIGALVCHANCQAEILKRADFSFNQKKDSQACGLYHALYKIAAGFGLGASSFVNSRKGDRRRPKEQYEARYRLTALFSGNRSIAEKVGAPGFHPWSCINLVLTLAYSPRANEVRRLETYLARENGTLAEAVLRGLDPGVSDKEKLEWIDSLQNDVEKVYFCYVLKYPYNPGGKPRPILDHFNLLGKEAADEVNRRYVLLAKSLSAQGNPAVYGLNPLHTLLVEARRADGSIGKQKDPLLWNHTNEMPEEAETLQPGTAPFFAQGIEPIYEEIDRPAMMDEYRRLQSPLGENLQRRIDLSKRIYQYSLGRPGQQADLRDALLLFGNDSYFLALSKSDHDAAGQTLFALAGLLKQGSSGGYGFEEAKKTIPSGLFKLLDSFESLKELLESYENHRALYHYMRTLLNDGLLMNCVGQIFSVLDNLKNSYSYNSQDNLEALREDLSENYLELEKIETNRWMELKNKVQKLINDEINELDHRPVLQVQVLNCGIQRNYGYIFGTVRNIGQAAAENIVLQANYDNNERSSQYVLASCSSGSKAVFEIDYSTAVQTKSLGYYLNLTFQYNGRQFSAPVCKGSLEIGEPGEPAYPSKILCSDPNGIKFSINEETGEVYSPEFVGRKKETAALRSLVRGTDFERYKSALVYGIRRTGKTSLLNYFAAFIKANHPEIICIMKDCEALPTSNYVQYVFIDLVMDTVERALPELRMNDGWEDLKQIWYSGHFCADQHPERLKLFYMDLKGFIGNRGIYLIIDEIDRLFQKIEKNQTKAEGNLDSLFGSLSEILNSVECKSVIHMVICGSNWLIRYNIRGNTNDQLFQRFGTEIIEIGKLPQDDAKAVICNPYKPYPQLNISKEALEWIWSYAGGLVWHTKLLGEQAICRAKENKRSAVYPSDVRMSMPSVIDIRWCKQFYEGCESGAEYQLIDAMQSLASKREGYIHISRISELLHWDIIEVQKVMVVLKALKVVEAHPVDQKLFRFGQDIYRRFFRSQPSRFEQVPEEADIFSKKREWEIAPPDPARREDDGLDDWDELI